MEKDIEKKVNQLADEGWFDKIVTLIEKIPEGEWTWPLVGWYIRSLVNSYEYEQAVEISLKYRALGENDPLWHCRYGYALLHLDYYQEAELALYRAKELIKGDESLVGWINEVLELIDDHKQKTESEARRRAGKVPRDPNKLPFEGFDFTDFWDDSDYALKEYVGAPPTNEQFEEVEKTLGYKLPESYKWLMQRHNGGIPVNTCHPVETPTSWAEDHIAISGIMGVDTAKLYSLLGSLGSRFMIEEWCYPDIGIAICDCPSAGHDMIFLDYRYCGRTGEPEVVHIGQERNYEITYIADDFESFIRGLVHEEVLAE